MKKQKIISILTIFSVISLMYLPFASADAEIIAQNYPETWNQSAWFSETIGGFAQVFNATQTAYLTSILIPMERLGSPTGMIYLQVRHLNNSVIEQSTTIVDASSILLGSTNLYVFNFAGTKMLYANNEYEWCLNASSTAGFSTGNVVFVNSTDPAGGYAGSAFFYQDEQWKDYEADYIFQVIGSTGGIPTPTPAPTATPSPIPTTDPSGGIWATLSPYGNMILPLVIILVVAILCGKFGGVWGFLAGLNIAAILIYAVMGATYFPLYGMVLLAVVDGLLLFGKVSGRV